jgi:imidazolonepropionase-like amidohydrolase
MKHLLLLLFVTGNLQAQAVVLRAQRLLDPASGAVRQNQFILVDGGRIVSVTAAPPVVKDARTIDLPYTVMPGMIDAHVHLVIGGPFAQNASLQLRAGFTTVADLGAFGLRMLRLRDSVHAGHIEGPRILASGQWVGTKGGVCEFNGLGIAGPPSAFADRVRANIGAGAELVKVCVTGWPAAAFVNPDSFEIDPVALDSVVAAARAAKRLVIAHDISTGGVRAALRAGVNGLAHAAYLDSATILEMKRANMWMIPTLASLTGSDASAASLGLRRSTILAHQAGVTLVFGTDGGVLPHGDGATELQALASAGLSPLEVLRAATINAARALGIADSVGTIAPRMSADLIAVDGDPLVDLEAMRRIRFVMLRGKSIEPRD